MINVTPVMTAEQIYQEMAVNDLERVRQYAFLQLHGFTVAVSKEK